MSEDTPVEATGTAERKNDKPVPVLPGQGLLEPPRQTQNMRAFGSQVLKVAKRVKGDLVKGAAAQVPGVVATPLPEAAQAPARPRTVKELLAARKAGTLGSAEPVTEAVDAGTPPSADDGFREAALSAGWDPDTMFESTPGPVVHNMHDGTDPQASVVSGMARYFKRNPRPE